ncbi:MAG: hypothetical protein C3F13_18395 [Anaerolineales bacterium]|nr:MAG: hypothetical protein C3F13_18395 [Anaerolineales bacterium]
MDALTIKRTKWFWPWQDEKEETWLEEMSSEGLHLNSVHLPCIYTFERGEPRRYTYRLDYMPLNRADKIQEYQQIFTDAGWQYIGEMSNWRYWRTFNSNNNASEIFTDRESKIRKYQRLLGYMAFFLFFLVFIAFRVFPKQPLSSSGTLEIVNAFYLFAKLCYMILIPIYVVVVIQLLRRINQLRHAKL